MREKIRVAALIGAGLINVVPVLGVLSANRISQGYGVDVSSPDLEILLRHRAVLFGLAGAFILYSAYKTELQKLAIGGGLVSMISFIVLAVSVGGYGAALEPIIIADVIGCVLLLLAFALKLSKPS
ncbi:MAG: phosphopantetheine adenylyltransferase [Rhodospirillaceae bacterium]|jgi:hypothetical protein|nr:phosphopantetheine adenylyltransferase [Rhodospirillaceae bacterium]MBT5242560.1 phosphopantetheine adenylyltransferase [Rhodospirillaceae bacterium]MBT5565590.1 phosphopantetheine adenylyltransferase [Rhodospirillaceae bacterium]MBT6088359.1 phosphopantetheine adenylyltransferase [Rhodospirillaceae bacterium]